jgi:uncharacterized membrane protein
VLLLVSSFLASALEMVEALTIVLAVGFSRQWRSTLLGVIVALMALAALVAALSSGARCPISRPTPEIVPQAMKAVALRALSSQ